jgi:hypothetical protein
MAEVFQHLTAECGPHCGAHMTGNAMYVGHCECTECHGASKE